MNNSLQIYKNIKEEEKNEWAITMFSTLDPV